MATEKRKMPRFGSEMRFPFGTPANLKRFEESIEQSKNGKSEMLTLQELRKRVGYD
jgi:hypothetical protein